MTGADIAKDNQAINHDKYDDVDSLATQFPLVDGMWLDIGHQYSSTPRLRRKQARVSSGRYLPKAAQPKSGIFLQTLEHDGLSTPHARMNNLKYSNPLIIHHHSSPIPSAAVLVNISHFSKATCG
jgi:hypothetical protein